MENEGYAINHPPLFKGEKFNHWKQRMITFFELCHVDLWDIVESGNFIPLNREVEPLARSSWLDNHK